MKDRTLLRTQTEQDEEAVRRGESEAHGQETKQAEQEKSSVSETWAEETIADLDDFIESQGIYIRQ